jgi:hypothetical protein
MQTPTDPALDGGIVWFDGVAFATEYLRVPDETPADDVVLKRATAATNCR